MMLCLHESWMKEARLCRRCQRLFRWNELIGALLYLSSLTVSGFDLVIYLRMSRILNDSTTELGSALLPLDIHPQEIPSH